MTIQDVEYIQELERRIIELESNLSSNIDILTLLFLILACSLFVCSIVMFSLMIYNIKKYG